MVKIVYISTLAIALSSGMSIIAIAISSGMTIIAIKTPYHLFLNQYVKSGSTFDLFGGVIIVFEQNRNRTKISFLYHDNDLRISITFYT